MGKIQVGQKSPKTVDMGGFTIAPDDATETKNGIRAEEKAKMEAAENAANLGGKTAEHTETVIENNGGDDDNGGSDVEGHVGSEWGDSSSDLSGILRKKPGRPKKSDGQ